MSGGAASWPQSLTRAPRVSSLSEQAPDVVLRTEMDVGQPKARRRFTGDVRRFDVSLDLTRAELDLFDAFFVDTIEGGALTFDWKHPRTGGDAVCRMLNVPTYRPQGPRTATPAAEWWVVTFQMETLPTTSLINAPTSGGDPAGGGTWPAMAAAGPTDQVDEPGAIDDETSIVIAFGLAVEDPGAAAAFVPDLVVIGYGARPMDYAIEDAGAYDDDTIVSAWAIEEKSKGDIGGGYGDLPGSSFGGGTPINPSTPIVIAYPGGATWYNIPSTYTFGG